MNFTVLTGAKTVDGSIRNWLNNGSVPATTVLTEAEAWIYGRLRVRPMLTAAEGSIASGAETLAFPADFLEPLYFGYRALFSGEITQKLNTDIEAARSFDSSGVIEAGQPAHYYLRGDPATAQFEKKTDQAYTYRLLYVAKPAALSGSNETNFVTSRAPRLLRCACMAYANEWIKNAGEMQRFLQLAAVEIEELNGQFERELRNIDFQALAR